MDQKTADRIIEQNRSNYDSFAESFSQTRNYLPEITKAFFAGRVKADDRVLDSGCGNGRFYPFFKEAGAVYAGIDNSEKLIAIAKEKYPEADFTVGDVLKIPFGENEFDMMISMAVLHHIPSKSYREQFFKEAWRVLKPGGFLVVAVWDLRPQALLRAKQWKRLAAFGKTQIRIVAGSEKLDIGDFYIPWQSKYRRYHHVFTVAEIKGLAKGAGFAVEEAGIMKMGERQSNLYIIAKKMQN
ncbi:MAG: class I SAM-dependent methyltransferase [Candidatus Pacebacteria bacterium]|jgi:ubiquinone/menaquinone biosynthesis C-methylase UbiE|nr:class I SAM-dependent methyltransferase [Candidatus Paceibacterota bacterium]